MALLDLLGRRWALRIIWELRDGQTPTFRQLQGRCGGTSSSVLTDRLRELIGAGIIDRSDTGYTLTTHGHDLLLRLQPLDQWAARWAKRQG